MGMSAGDSDCTTGLSGRIYTYLTGDSRNGFSSPMTAAQSGAVKALCYAVARGVVAEVNANGACSITVSIDQLAAGVPASATILGGSIS